jgi:hypothetical protein
VVQRGGIFRKGVTAWEGRCETDPGLLCGGGRFLGGWGNGAGRVFLPYPYISSMSLVSLGS